jgi:hypothetical protein
MRREYWQSHDCSGYRARISVVWETPNDVESLADPHNVAAEKIAEDVLAALAPKPLEIVQAMMGRLTR